MTSSCITFHPREFLMTSRWAISHPSPLLMTRHARKTVSSTCISPSLQPALHEQQYKLGFLSKLYFQQPQVSKHRFLACQGSGPMAVALRLWKSISLPLTSGAAGLGDLHPPSVPRDIPRKSSFWWSSFLESKGWRQQALCLGDMVGTVGIGESRFFYYPHVSVTSSHQPSTCSHEGTAAPSSS